jgi:hypothetical protein
MKAMMSCESVMPATVPVRESSSPAPGVPSTASITGIRYEHTHNQNHEEVDQH